MNNNLAVTTSSARERVLLVGVDVFLGQEHDPDFQAALTEAQELVRAAGGTLVTTVSCKRSRPDAALFVGRGKAEEWAAVVLAEAIDLVVFNHELTPTQERNLEKILQCRVIDRVGLILAIFARRAQTQEGRLQVELAQLVHLSGRLVRGYRHLQSQRGGIGIKGPGETQLETDRRLIAKRITRLRTELQQVKKQRGVQRQQRMRQQVPIVALVGYTNVGKSTLFNRLTRAEVLVKDQLFATLDTTARRLWLNETLTVIVTDTVGFIRRLPHGLIAAFSATLEETAFADLLLHVVDINDDSAEQKREVNAVLSEIAADHVPQLLVMNQIDRLPENERHAGIVHDAAGRMIAVRTSAMTGAGMDELRAALVALLTAQSTT